MYPPSARLWAGAKFRMAPGFVDDDQWGQGSTEIGLDVDRCSLNYF